MSNIDINNGYNEDDVDLFRRKLYKTESRAEFTEVEMQYLSHKILSEFYNTKLQSQDEAERLVVQQKFENIAYRVFMNYINRIEIYRLPDVFFYTHLMVLDYYKNHVHKPDYIELEVKEVTEACITVADYINKLPREVKFQEFYDICQSWFAEFFAEIEKNMKEKEPKIENKVVPLRPTNIVDMTHRRYTITIKWRTWESEPGGNYGDFQKMDFTDILTASSFLNLQCMNEQAFDLEVIITWENPDE